MKLFKNFKSRATLEECFLVPILRKNPMKKALEVLSFIQLFHASGLFLYPLKTIGFSGA